MSTRNYIQEIEYNIANGVDNISPPSMLAAGYVRKAQNCNLGLTGGYFKRQGYTEALTSAWTGKSIDYGVEFLSSAGTLEVLLFGSGSFGKLDGLGGVTTILGTLSAGFRVSTTQFEDRLYAFNGDSTNIPFVYGGGLTTRALGIAPPAAAPAVAAALGGSLVPGSYVVGYTYIIRDNVTNRIVAESALSPLQTVALAAPNNALNVTVVASGMTLLTNETLFIRIYRTVASGSVLFLAEDNVSNTNHVELITDSDAVVTQRVQGSVDQYQLSTFSGYDKARFPIAARNRLFIAHNNRNELRWSKIGQEGPLPESYAALGYATVEGKLGSLDTLVGLGQINDIPIILKSDSIGYLEEVGLPELLRAEDPVTYLYRELSDSIGAVAHHAQTQVINELVFLSRDNIYATDGRVIRPIANSIKSQITSLGFNAASQVKKISMGNDILNRRIYISVFETELSVLPKIVLVGDYQQYPNFRWTTYEPGTNELTHPGIVAGSYFSVTNVLSGKKEIHFGNIESNGQFYKMNDGDSDNDNAIAFKVISRPYDMQHPMITKLFKKIKSFVQASNSSYALEFCIFLDLNETEEIFCEEFFLPSAGNNWDEHNWADDAETEPDPLIWGGAALAELEYDPHKKGKFIQVVFNQNDVDAPVALLGWGISGSIFGGL